MLNWIQEVDKSINTENFSLIRKTFKTDFKVIVILINNDLFTQKQNLIETKKADKKLIVKLINNDLLKSEKKDDTEICQ